jgi:hypothetical protein
MRRSRTRRHQWVGHSRVSRRCTSRGEPPGKQPENKQILARAREHSDGVKLPAGRVAAEERGGVSRPSTDDQRVSIRSLRSLLDHRLSLRSQLNR